MNTTIAIFTGALLMLVMPPTAHVAGMVGQSDPDNLYVLVSTDLTSGLGSVLAADGVREIGLGRTPVSAMIEASSDVHEELLAGGYWLIPASKIVALCGATVT